MNTTPEPFSSIIDNVTAADKKYFADHPGASSYIRAHTPGEFYPYQVESRFVVVKKLSDDVRVREPLLEAL